MKPSFKVLIPDGESNLVIKVLRSLLDISGVSVYILSPERELGIRHSKIVRYFEHGEALKESRHWIERINTLMTKHDIDVLMPVHLSAIRRLLACQDQLRYPGRTLLPPSCEMLRIAEEKYLLAKYMKQIGTPHPGSWPLYQPNGTLSELEALNYPLLMKPTQGLGGGIGIKRFDNARELRKYLSNGPPPEEVMLQEFVTGTDLGFNVLCKGGNILAYSIQLGTLFHDEAFKPQIGLKMIDDEAVLQSMSHLLKAMRWNGVAHIDLIYNPESGEFKVLEMNPRFWLTLHASTMAGINFPWYYCQAAVGNHIPNLSYRKEEYLEISGLKKWLKLNPLRILRMRYIWQHTPVRNVLKDPLILIFNIYYEWRSKVRNLF